MADEQLPARRSTPLWKQRRVQIAAGAVAIVLVGVGMAVALAGGGDDEPTASITSRAGTTTDASTAPTTVPALAPLTGLPDPSGASLTRSALSVKIDNVHAAARPPQAGLDIADVVYEEPVEGATRFLAVFHSTTPERVGPIRSTRFLDPGIVWPIRGLYVYSGGTAPKVEAIREAPVQTIDENGLVSADARIRDDSIRRPHNLFAVPQKVWDWDQVSDRTPPAALFLYRGAETGAFPGTPASAVAIPTLSEARYTWDPATRTWKREQRQAGGGVGPHLAESGAQVSPANLIVQRIGGVEDKAGLVGEGDAWVFSDGKMAVARWQRSTLESRTFFVAADGRELELTPGTTWVHLITSGEPTVTP